MNGSISTGAVREMLDADSEFRVSTCSPPFTWTDCDSEDLYEASASKDGEWVVVTRVSQVRREAVSFHITRDALAHVVGQLGGTLP